MKKDRFLNKIDKIVDAIRNKYRVMVMGDLNRWIT